ncbi:hypothetical protein HYH03_000779 [Edaphochlamys debaryana]|uniref:Uncharacterized protein n=1 Tax=Edaphochlamys debaryana TaxID=47281 RepID=A0A835YE77_9CHLO|nr:hypothetical protein HYH03_000779 [Edaphochlamys debaryana]|eukprot:KAG2500956.1 hypothetical protein HYH03_000779 [Edaphochlamys debaryana]
MANPIEAVSAFFSSGLRKAQEHPVCQHASKAIQRFQAQHEERQCEARLPPRIVVLPRGAPLAAIIPGDSTAELVLTNGLNNFLNLYNTALIVRLVLTWFPNPPEVIVSPLATICDPYLNLFRGIIPPLGGSLDFSPILAFVVLNLFTNSAAALPCEVPNRRARAAAAAAAAAQPAAAAAPSPAAVASGQWLAGRLSRGEALFRRRVACQQAAAEARSWAARV